MGCELPVNLPGKGRFDSLEKYYPKAKGDPMHERSRSAILRADAITPTFAAMDSTAESERVGTPSDPPEHGAP